MRHCPMASHFIDKDKWLAKETIRTLSVYSVDCEAFSQLYSWQCRGLCTDKETLTSWIWKIQDVENFEETTMEISNFLCTDKTAQCTVGVRRGSNIYGQKVAKRVVNKMLTLLFWTNKNLSCLDVPDRHPECMWAPAQDPSQFQFNCTWFGAYPTPTLRWGEDEGKQGARWKERVYATEETDSLALTLNRSMLSDGQTLRCMVQHLALAPGKEKSCSFTLSKHVVWKMRLSSVLRCSASESFMCFPL